MSLWTTSNLMISYNVIRPNGIASNSSIPSWWKRSRETIVVTCRCTTQTQGMCWSGVNSIFDCEAFQITWNSISSPKLEVYIYFYHEHRYEYHHYSEISHNLVICFAVFDI